MTDDIICKGCYTLGSACGQCSKCEKQLLDLIAELTDADPCNYDHHGNCQAHSLNENPCPHETAKWVLSHRKE